MINLKTKLFSLTMACLLPLALAGEANANIITDGWDKTKKAAKDGATKAKDAAVDTGKKAASDAYDAGKKSVVESVTGKTSGGTSTDTDTSKKEDTTTSSAGDTKKDPTAEKHAAFECTTDHCNKKTCNDANIQARCTACKTMTDAKGKKQTMSPSCKTASSQEEVDTSGYECTTSYCSSKTCGKNPAIKTWCSENCQSELPKMSARCKE